MNRPFFFNKDNVEHINTITSNKDYDTMYFDFEYMFDMFFLRCRNREDYDSTVKTIQGAFRSSTLAWEEGNPVLYNESHH